MTNESASIADEFQELDEHLRHHGRGPGLAEIHGMACGLACAGRQRSDAADWLALLGAMAERADIRRVLDSVFSLARDALGSTGFEFQPLLPGDRVDVARRVDAIADWCSGFALGYAHAGGAPADEPSREAIEDIRAMSGMVDDDDQESTKQGNLAQVEEYLRVAVQLLFEESR